MYCYVLNLFKIVFMFSRVLFFATYLHPWFAVQEVICINGLHGF